MKSRSSRVRFIRNSAEHLTCTDCQIQPRSRPERLLSGRARPNLYGPAFKSLRARPLLQECPTAVLGVSPHIAATRPTAMLFLVLLDRGSACEARSALEGG